MSTLATSRARQAPSNELLRQLLDVLSSEPLRTGPLLAKLNIDQRLGEDAVWLLLQRGLVAMGPDSTLRVKDGKHSGAKARGTTPPRCEIRTGVDRRES